MTKPIHKHDVIIVGAGISGMYALQKMRELGLSAHILESKSGVGGTWHVNEYPGCRFDSESVTYGYSFSKELIQEWDWSEEYAAQPETKAYLQYAAKKFDWEKDITFNTRVNSAKWDEQGGVWNITTDQGDIYQGTYFLPCIGVLSTPILPDFEGINEYKGRSLHPIDWTAEFSEYIKGRRVAVIGTGSTAIQIIPKIAEVVSHLTVFQRTANWTMPLRNQPITAGKSAEYKAMAGQIFAECNETNTGFRHGANKTSIFDMSKEEREAYYENLSQHPGFALWLRAHYDTFIDEGANNILSDFVRRKIVARLESLDIDQETRECLTPCDHGFGAKRVPMETDYYEAYARDNVTLYNAKKNPIQEITANGIKTAEGEMEFDAIIYATGFDAISGSYTQFDIIGTDGQTLAEKWKDGPRTYLGMGINNFPNLMMPLGPLSGGLLCNLPRCIEEGTNWLAGCIGHAEKNGISRIEPSKASENAWVEECVKAADGMIMAKTNSWFNGANVPGKKPAVQLFLGGRPVFRKFLAGEAESGYDLLNGDKLRLAECTEKAELA